MKHMPQIAFYAAVAILLAGSLVGRLDAPDHHRAALSLSMESGHVSFKAELGAALIALRL
jgi:predicted small integral membrane protein